MVIHINDSTEHDLYYSPVAKLLFSLPPPTVGVPSWSRDVAMCIDSMLELF